MKSWGVLGVVAVVSIALPTVTGLLVARNSVVTAPTELYGFGFTVEALLFPALASVVAAACILPAVQDRYLVYMRTRSNFVDFCRRACCRSAALSFLVFFGSTLLWGLISFVLDPLVHISSDFGLGYIPGGDAHGSTFTQLVAVSPLLYLVAHSMWVGLWAGGYAFATALLLLAIPNPLVAIAAPLVIYWADNIALANLEIEQFRAVTVIFPFSMSQMPLWTVAVPVVVWGALLALLWIYLERRRYATGVTL